MKGRRGAFKRRENGSVVTFRSVFVGKGAEKRGPGHIQGLYGYQSRGGWLHTQNLILFTSIRTDAPVQSDHRRVETEKKANTGLNSEMLGRTHQRPVPGLVMHSSRGQWCRGGIAAVAGVFQHTSLERGIVVQLIPV